MRVLELPPALSAIAVFLAVIPYGAARTKSAQPVHVQCAAGRDFTLPLGPRLAIVDLSGKRLTLMRRPSSLDQHYRDEAAALIVDGRYVASFKKTIWIGATAIWNAMTLPFAIAFRSSSSETHKAQLTPSISDGNARTSVQGSQCRRLLRANDDETTRRR